MPNFIITKEIQVRRTVEVLDGKMDILFTVPSQKESKEYIQSLTKGITGKTPSGKKELLDMTKIVGDISERTKAYCKKHVKNIFNLEEEGGGELSFTPELFDMIWDSNPFFRKAIQEELKQISAGNPSQVLKKK